MDVKAVAMLGVLAAIGAALRPLGAGTAGLETVFFLLVLGGRVFGAGLRLRARRRRPCSPRPCDGRGRAVAAVPDARGRVGRAGAPGSCPRCGGGRRSSCSRGTAWSAGLAYGLLLNLSFWPFATGMAGELSFVAGEPLTENLHRFLVFTLATSLGWDIGRAVTTGVLVLRHRPGRPGALRRAARRAAFEEPVAFRAATVDSRGAASGGVPASDVASEPAAEPAPSTPVRPTVEAPASVARSGP